ncbi:MAG: DUF975 family protein [Phycisphaerales bacterium]|jgi:uncharacterized membrane protein|nr:DUF975 family protein [Phycisphaerales bacterium]MBT7170272.1 DUF975 family protein [Phycisphaerales bacterium]
MRQWYCTINGQQYGPADEFLFEQWIIEGRVTPETYVWSEGMDEWIRAIAVMPELFGSDATTTLSMVDPKPLGGTGGHTSNKELMRRARESLSGKWGSAVGFSFLLGVITTVISWIPFVGGMASLVTTGAFVLGGMIFYMTLVRRGRTEMGMMFKGFENFGNSLGAHLLVSLFVFLWALLLIIPGIIAAMSYSQTFFLLANDRTLGPLQAIRKSKEMMEGHKWRRFCLDWRFFGWSLLCILTLGIGFLWLTPYMFASRAMFFEDLMKSKANPDSTDREETYPQA